MSAPIPPRPYYSQNHGERNNHNTNETHPTIEISPPPRILESELCHTSVVSFQTELG
jgi:hypothetical protein